MTDDELDDWKHLSCFLEVDLEYPEDLHDLHNDYPLAPERIKISNVEKLIPNLNNKTNYDIKLSVGSDLVRSLGCNDLSAVKKFALPLGSDPNMLTHSVPNLGLPVPIKIKTDVGFAILIDELPTCVFGRDEILCS